MAGLILFIAKIQLCGRSEQELLILSEEFTNITHKQSYYLSSWQSP